MSQLSDDIAAAAASTDQAATDAANRVIDTINTNNAVITDLQTKNAADEQAIADLQAQIDASAVTPEAAQAVLDQLTATKAKIDAIDAAPMAPVETPAV